MKSKRKKKLSKDEVTEEVIKRLDGHLTNADYLKHDGILCPRCKDPSYPLAVADTPGLTTITHYNDNSTKTRRLIRCPGCQFTFWDMYDLVGFAEYREGDEREGDF